MKAGSSKSGSSRKAAVPVVCVGSRAPEFALPATWQAEPELREVSLADYRDHWLVLIFYPRDFSMVCPTELTALGSQLGEFTRRDCHILGISTDSIESHEQWIATPRSQGGLGGLSFPLASDLDGAVSRKYGVYLPQQHMSLRGLFIIDPNGVLQYQVVHNLSVGRRADEVLRVLDGLQSGGLCPESWTREEPTIDPARALLPNSVIGQYKIETQLGSGTYAVVFRARDQVLERPVALKVFRPRAPSAPRRLLEEARAAAALNHPNVCTVFSVSESGGVPMIVMEYIEGQPLKKTLERERLSLEDVKHVTRQIAQGMAAAHGHQIVHGDLKPANIMITPDRLAKIMDFGLAHRDPQASPTAETGTWDTADPAGLSGTPDYMSPEQARSQPATSASDVFALGLVIYEMLSGDKAIRGDSLLSVLREIDTLDPARYATGMPEPFATILRRSLITDPAKRDLTMADIVELLNWRDLALAT